MSDCGIETYKKENREYKCVLVNKRNVSEVLNEIRHKYHIFDEFPTV